MQHARGMRNTYKILVRNSEGNKPLGRLRYRWEDNIKKDLKELAMLGGSLVTMAWCVLRLWMEGKSPDMESSCKYIE
jgi:hypothetical protein